MYNKIFLLVILAMVLQVRAQKLNHAIGFNYSELNGAYGNATRLSLMYTPQLQKNKGMFLYGISSPLQIGRYISTARSDNRHLIIQLPIMLEMGLNLNTPCTSFKYLSMFTGFGFSRELNTGNRSYKSDYMNATLGIRVPPFNKPFEIRFNYARSMELIKREIYSVGVSYIFK